MNQTLPKFSGISTRCSAYHGVHVTAEIVRKTELDDLIHYWDTMKRRQQCALANYVSSGRHVGQYLPPVEDLVEENLATWYPDFWLHREYAICGYCWDESIAGSDDEVPGE